jgi:N-acetylglucosaminyldiphosphoundecaprenol N-acetyl-beta-D-mannosaminyltransferase
MNRIHRTPFNSKGNVIGILIDAVEYKAATDRIVRAGRDHQPMAISALAVHGLMTGVLDSEYKYRLNHFDLLVPDGQPVRWALNLLHGARLQDRVYGPNLMLAVCDRAQKEGLSVFLYGSTEEILFRLGTNLQHRFPSLRISGMKASKFRRLTNEEQADLTSEVRRSGASIVFVGLGCPRQEVWAYEFRDTLSMPIVAVGAAFPFLAGTIPQAPKWMQDRGLEWLFRLSAEPRLWRRYVFLNPAYILLVAFQVLGFSQFRTDGTPPCREPVCG